MKRLLSFVLMFVIASALLVGISYGADEERFVLSDLTVKDKKTGLMWTRNANLVGLTSFYGAKDYINRVNKQKYEYSLAGYTDWRLPSKEELVTLIDYAKGKGYKKDFHQVLTKVGFEKVQDGYWSSSTYVNYPREAWFVNMFDGHVHTVNKTNIGCVWPVRAGQ